MLYIREEQTFKYRVLIQELDGKYRTYILRHQSLELAKEQAEFFATFNVGERVVSVKRA